MTGDVHPYDVRPSRIHTIGIQVLIPAEEGYRLIRTGDGFIAWAEWQENGATILVPGPSIIRLEWDGRFESLPGGMWRR